MIEDFYEKNKKLVLFIVILIIFIILMTLVYTSSQNKSMKNLDEKGCGCNGNKKYDYYDKDKYYNNYNYNNGNNRFQLEQQINQLLAQQAALMQQVPVSQQTTMMQQSSGQLQNEVLPTNVSRINNGVVNQMLPVVNLPQGNFIQNLPIFSNLNGPVITNIRNQPITGSNLRNNVVLNPNDLLSSTNGRRFTNNLIPRNSKGFDLDDSKLTKKKRSKKSKQRKSKKY